MNKRYQVFVSSTYQDLQDERKEVIQALLELDCIPAGMELFPATDDDQWTLIKRVIDDCDYYIVIIGGRYGSLSDSGDSFTQKEYDYAVSIGKPAIGFIHSDPGSIPAKKTEQSEEGKIKLQSFSDIVKKKHCKFWKTPSELGSVVSRSLVQLMKAKPAIGWIRANSGPDESTLQEILRLKNIVEELKTELETIHFEAPTGTEELAQGKDEFNIHYKYSTRNKDAQYEASEEYDAILVTTWDEVFNFIAPRMISVVAEGALKGATLPNFVQTMETTKLLEEHVNCTFSDFRIRSEDFQTIKIQLRALGLIVENEEHKKSGMVYWELTPYGDNMMTKLRAVKKTSPI